MTPTAPARKTPPPEAAPASSRSRARRLSAVLVLVGTVLAALLGGAGPASAHAALRSADPAEDTVLEAAPRHITLTFTEKVSMTNRTIRVISPSNTQVAKGDPRHTRGDGTAIRIGLRDGLPDGTYTVAWHVVSADSHPASGAYTFSIGEPSGTTAVVPADTAGNGTTERLYGVARYAAYGGLALLVGGFAFALLCLPYGPVPRPLRRLVAAGWSVLALATVALLLLRGPYENGDGPLRALDLSALPATFGSRPGAALLFRLLLLAVAGACLALPAAGFRGVTAKTARAPGRTAAGPDTAPDGAAGGEGDGSPGSGGAAVDAGADAVDQAGNAGAAGTAEAGTAESGAADGGDDAADQAGHGAAAPAAARAATGTPQDPAGGPGGPHTADGTPHDRRPPALVLIAAALLTVGLAATWVTVEHASVGPQAPFAVTVAGLHLVAMTVWVGGLAALSVTVLRRGGPSAEDGAGDVTGSREGNGYARAAGRFSTLAFVSVTVLVLTGLVQSWRQVGAWDLLLTTFFGKLLLTKAVIVLLLLVVAGVSRRLTAGLRGPGPSETAPVPMAAPEPEPELVAVGAGVGAGGSGAAHSPPAGHDRGDNGPGDAGPRATAPADAGPAGERTGEETTAAGGTAPDRTAGPVSRGRPSGAVPPSSRGGGSVREGLRRSVIAELAIGAVILAVTAVLTGTQPARAVLDASEEIAARGAAVAVVDVPLDTGTEAGDAAAPGVETVANVTVDPARVGTNRVQVLVLAGGGLVGVPEVRVSFTLEEKGIGPLDARLEDAGGYWINDDLRLPLPGKWTMAVTVRTSEFDQVTKTVTVEVRPVPGSAPEKTGTG
ncbi:copper resistance protein CopC [Streptomyces sp. WAC 00631]|uniref:copper resistance CopC/CopD family protein n=1 Tax=Streptomyces sp. WAC 00631 TaxID=2203201 RepID=UPI00163B72C4|nr:copper resistance protein CopC [Streptomyces sp. WAC 00631]MCC5036916.1 copper resistance protein CopC [Streptomyces sp. WAC 00631]